MTTDESKLAKKRWETAQRRRFKMHLLHDGEEEMIKLIEAFVSYDEYIKRDLLDRAVISRTAHWFGVYVRKVNSLSGEYGSLKTQFSLISILIAVESAIGMPKGGRPSGRIYSFYNANLDDQQKEALTSSIQIFSPKTSKFIVPSLKRLVSLLMERRNGLVHRAELINLNDEGTMSIATMGHSRGGKTSGHLDLRLTPDQLTAITKAALKNYFSKDWPERVPMQDFSLLRRKK